jgi:transcriptional regulator with XRE-family HTH domain
MPSKPAIAVAVGRAVRSLREQEGLSQDQLATRCGMHRTYIGGIERGERNPTVSVLYRLADGLQTTGSGLLSVAEAQPDISSRGQLTPTGAGRPRRASRPPPRRR